MDRLNAEQQPTIEALFAFVENPLFERFYRHMGKEYGAICKMQYSRCSWARGRNVKFMKKGRSLCVAYPQKGMFSLLVVVGNRERAQVEFLLPHLCADMQKLYRDTEEGNGQRRHMIPLNTENELYRDTPELIHIRYRNA